MRLWCQWAWLGGDTAQAGVVLDVDGDRLVGVEVVGPPPAGIEQLRGLTLPGLVNAHSHAFHRALRSRTQAGRGTFWTWRDQMYRLAATLTPESYGRLAAATFAEMAEAGITTVGEFHYLHHQPGGRPYADDNEMGEAIRAAADEAGVRLTLLDTCYLHGGIGAEPNEVQQRFADASAEAWAERVATMADGPAVRVGAAVHSVRAVAPEEMAVVRQWCDERDLAVHAHVSEQPAENDDCRAAYGATPVEVFGGAGLLGERFTAVHATHLTDGDISALGGSHVCFCPTTERDLADGIGPAAALTAAGAGLCLGSDSHAVIDLFEEARAVELDARLATGERGHLPAAALLTAATAGGARLARLARGRSPRSGRAGGPHGRGPRQSADGRRRARPPRRGRGLRRRGGGRARRDGRRPLGGARRRARADAGGGAVGGRHRRGVGGGIGVTALVVDHIGLLVTNDPALGDGFLGVVRDAALVVEDGVVTAVTAAGAAAADERIDAGGRCVIPGFVDSHTHLVFAGDRAEEFTARMAGRPYAAGGIAVTSTATRSAGDDELRAMAAARATAARQGGTTHLEIKSGYALDVEGEARLCRLATELTDDVTFLGAHLVPAEYADRPDDYVALVTGPMLDACAPWCRWIDVFCETGAFDADQSRAVLEAGAARGLGLRVHANQLGPGPGVQLAVELGAASADHCTLPHRRRRRRAGRRDDGGDAAAGRRLLDPPALPGRPPPARRRRHRGPGQQLQPGLELHDVDAVLHRPGRAGHAHDRRGGAVGGDRGRCRGPPPRRPRPAVTGRAALRP